MTSEFRTAVRDELWLRGRLAESRLSHGRAIDDERGIVASDARDDALLSACEREMTRLRESARGFDARVRMVAEARREDGAEEVSATMTVAVAGLSVVTTPEHAARDYELLRTVASVAPEGEAIDYRGIPLVWRHGSAAVLLHEAAGHAAEHDHGAADWPRWLSIDIPLRMRRATFRDVPLRRMSRVAARQEGAPFELPRRRIEVLLVGGGSYEPLTELVTVRVAAADLVDGESVRRLPPFEIRESRDAVARALAGAEGDPLRYPGVICSREGQELVVGSSAPVVITVFA